MKGFARRAKDFGLDPVGSREPGKVSRQGRGVLRREEAWTAQSEAWSGRRLKSPGDQGRVGLFRFLESSLRQGPVDCGSTLWYPQRSKRPPKGQDNQGRPDS